MDIFLINIPKKIMATSKEIKAAFQRNEQLLSRQPALGQKTGKVKVTLEDGLCCRVESGCWKFSSDMPAGAGGAQTAPSPGVYVAGALGSCIATMAKMWAAKLDIPIKSIEIEVSYEADMRMLFGINNIPAHWKRISYAAHVESEAPEEDIQKVLDLAHHYSHVRGDLEHAFRIERQRR
jgi:uncharacterized OsmC-like protein